MSGFLLPFVGIRDHTFNESSGILYVTTGDGTLHLWNVESNELVRSFQGIAEYS